MPESSFNPGPFYLGRASRPLCLVAFLWICYTCSAFLLWTRYLIAWETFNYTPVALGAGLGLIMIWWGLDARRWFKGPMRSIDAVLRRRSRSCFTKLACVCTYNAMIDWKHNIPESSWIGRVGWSPDRFVRYRCQVNGDLSMRSRGF